MRALLYLFLLAAPGDKPKPTCIAPPARYHRLELDSCVDGPEGSVLCGYPFAFQDYEAKWSCAVLLRRVGCGESFVPYRIVCMPQARIASR